MNKQKNTEIIKKIKNYLRRGDFYVIIQRIKEQYQIQFSRSAVASTLNPYSNYFNRIIYNEALKLSVERQRAMGETSVLEAQLKD